MDRTSNQEYRQIIKECARTREYAPEYREDGSKMSLRERAELAPTMPLRQAMKWTRGSDAVWRDEMERMADFYRMKDSMHEGD